MDWALKVDLPHALYRIFNEKEEPIYIGCSQNIYARLKGHLSERLWRCEIATVKVTWFAGYLAAARAEAEAIRNEKPKYNVVVSNPENIGNHHRPKRTRGDGIHCPKCGEEKENRKKAYCPACERIYRENKKRAEGWTPRPPPTTICPKCKGTKEPGPSYCRRCRNEITLANYHKRQKKKAQEIAEAS